MLTLAGRYGLNGMDALHIVAAIAMRANKFVTTERPARSAIHFFNSSLTAS